MQVFKKERTPVPRRTILQDIHDLTEEPHSLPATPVAQLSPRTPGSRRPTEPGHGYVDPSYPLHPLYNGALGDSRLQHHKWTQEDQDQYDERIRKKAMSELVESWMDRLQLISVITTFFAAIEAQLIGTTTPDDPSTDSLVDQAANAALAGALVVHTFAAIMSFLAAFFLIRYKLSVAKREERRVEAQAAGATTVSSSSVWSMNWRLEQVGPFRRGEPPTHLLDHCHSLCMGMAAIGFVLALVGVLCFVWSRLPRSSAYFSSVCMAACIVGGLGALFWPASSVHRKLKTK